MRSFYLILTMLLLGMPLQAVTEKKWKSLKMKSGIKMMNVIILHRNCTKTILTCMSILKSS